MRNFEKKTELIDDVTGSCYLLCVYLLKIEKFSMNVSDKTNRERAVGVFESSGYPFH